MIKRPTSPSLGMLDVTDKTMGVLANYNKMVEKSTNFLSGCAFNSAAFSFLPL
jgi:hypothetical protein